LFLKYADKWLLLINQHVINSLTDYAFTFAARTHVHPPTHRTVVDVTLALLNTSLPLYGTASFTGEPVSELVSLHTTLVPTGRTHIVKLHIWQYLHYQRTRQHNDSRAMTMMVYSRLPATHLSLLLASSLLLIWRLHTR